jgi:peptidoglycan hydrolase CwlO-like protein
MTNPKIEKVKEQIAKTKDIIAEYQTKLRDLEKQKTDLENLAVIAMFRKEKLDENEFSQLLHSMRKEEPEPAAPAQLASAPAAETIAGKFKIEKEERPDVKDE